MNEKINVYRFEDYRNLLGALIQQRKKEKKFFSYRWFAKRAGFSSPNFLNLVVKGKRHLSIESLEKVIAIFQLTKSEAEFFRYLVHFNRAKTLSEKEHFAHQLVKLRKFQGEFPLSQAQFEYYSIWHLIPVREILNLQNPPRSEQEISELLTPSVSPTSVRAALEKLRALDMVTATEDGWRVKNESVTTGHKFSSFGVVQFHKKMLELASSSLDRFPAEDRDISSVTLGLSDRNFLKIKSLIEEFRSQLMSLSEDDSDKDRIVQINLQMFPLSHRRVKSK